MLNKSVFEKNNYLFSFCYFIKGDILLFYLIDRGKILNSKFFITILDYIYVSDLKEILWNKQKNEILYLFNDIRHYNPIIV